MKNAAGSTGFLVNGFGGLDIESPAVDIAFFVNRPSNPIPQMEIQENAVFFNKDIEMESHSIDNVNRINFDAVADKAIIGLSTSIRHDVPDTERHRFRVGITDVMEIGEDVIFTATKEMKSPERISIEDGKQLIMKNFSGQSNLQFIWLSDTHPQLTYADNFSISRNLSPLITFGTDIDVFEDIDLNSNDLKKVKTVGLLENFAAGFAPTPVTDTAIWFTRPNGSGKTELRVKFQNRYFHLDNKRGLDYSLKEKKWRLKHGINNSTKR